MKKEAEKLTVTEQGISSDYSIFPWLSARRTYFKLTHLMSNKPGVILFYILHIYSLFLYYRGIAFHFWFHVGEFVMRRNAQCY